MGKSYTNKEFEKQIESEEKKNSACQKRKSTTELSY